MENNPAQSLSPLSAHLEADRHQKAMTAVRALNNTHGGDDEKLWEAARGFESMFLNQMYKAMRKTIPESEENPASTGRKIFTEMLDMEYSKLHAGSNKNGLAGLIYRQLLLERNGEIPEEWKIAPQSAPAPAGGYSAPVHSSKSEISARLGPKMADSELEPLINQAAKKYNVDKNLIKSVIANESDNRPQAVSKAGAKGLMQLMDGTARDMDVSRVYDPEDNINGGVRYLRQLLDRYDGDETLSLAAYNAGPARVVEYGGVPPFAETQEYVQKVLGKKERLDIADLNKTNP